jgi:HAMP domain-containing protein
MSMWILRGLLVAVAISVIVGLRFFGRWLQRAGARMERTKRGDEAREEASPVADNAHVLDAAQAFGEVDQGWRQRRAR